VGTILSRVIEFFAKTRRCLLAFFESIRMPQSGLGAKNSVGPGELRALGRRIIKKGGNNFQA